MRWFYLMKDRFELFSKCMSLNEIKNTILSNLKVFGPDNALEYMSLTFKDFFTSQGILHETSCAYTPQQNGVAGAERKHRHLLEVKRSLMLHISVTNPYWLEALLTAWYLINQMPRSLK